VVDNLVRDRAVVLQNVVVGGTRCIDEFLSHGLQDGYKMVSYSNRLLPHAFTHCSTSHNPCGCNDFPRRFGVW
jgi:hypothetical protein